MYKKLIDVVEQRQTLEVEVKKLKAKFADDHAVIIAQLEDLKEKEVLMREEVMLTLEKDNKDSVEVEDKVIIRQTRITKGVDDASALKNAMVTQTEVLADSGVLFDVEELFAEETVVMDKKEVLSIADKFNKLTGNDLDGMLLKTTKFIAVKDKK